jgi:uncharacterized GH25 family protein
MKYTPTWTRAATSLARFALCAGLAAGLIAPAVAHDFWIEPGSHTPAPGQAVNVRLRVGEHFRGDPLPRPAPQRMQRFVLADTQGGPVGTVPGRTGADPAGQLRLQQPGRHVIGFEGQPIAIGLPARVFNAYLKEEGLDAVIEARAARGQADAPGREIYSRHAKSLLQVGRAADSDGMPADRVLGLTLELVAEAPPAATPPGAAWPVRLLLDGQPLPGVLVMALRHAEPARRIEQRSDADGRVRLPLDGAGRWLVKAVHMRPAPAGSGADWQSLWASLTFEAAGAPT